MRTDGTLTNKEERKMCEICRQNPCAGTCPNADPPEVLHSCPFCGEDIVEGEEYYVYHSDDGDVYYHEDCFYDKAVAICLETGIVEKCDE